MIWPRLKGLEMLETEKKDSVDLPVERITCQSCVSAIEKGLAKLRGVTRITANPANSTVHVEYDATQVGIGEIADRLNVLGYPAKAASEQFDIEGMHCASCMARIEKSLKNLPGVIAVSLNLAEQSATVDNLSATTNPGKIMDAIAQSGYKAVPRGGGGGPVAEESYHRRLRRNLWIALPLALLISALSHLGMAGIMPFGHRGTNYLLFALTLPVQFFCGRQFYSGFWTALKSRSATMDSLVVLGTSAAFLYSAVATFFPALISATGQIPHVYYDTSAIIITLILLGRLFESRARRSVAEEVEKLARLESAGALVIRDGVEMLVNSIDVAVGDTVVVKPGGKVPVDGTVIEGFSAVDESMLTGESLPREVKPGDRVLAGSINSSGFFKFRAQAVGMETVLNRIVTAVRAIIASKAPVQKLADKVAAVFVPIVLCLAIMAFLLWMILPDQPDLAFALLIFIAVLIVACPCALGLATPTAIMVGSARGAREGILFRSAEILERVHRIDTVVFDKTGTLTEARPVVQKFVTFNPYSQAELLPLAGSLARASEHPLASAVVAFASQQGAAFYEVNEFESFPGRGIKGRVSEAMIHMGSLAFMEDLGFVSADLREEIRQLIGRGGSQLFLAINTELAAGFLMADNIRTDAAAAIKRLQSAGRKVVMLSGDNRLTAEEVAAQIGIEEVISGVLPHEKADHIKSLKASGRVVAMVGEGVNDAPALAAADVGIALGSGTDVAISFADITLVGSRLEAVARALKLSEKSLRTIKQNLWWAFGYNLLAIPIAAGLFYPGLGILLSPVVASAAMALSSLFVVTNSLRLRHIRL